MNQQKKTQNQPSQFLIQELVRLFEIYIEGPEGCRQRSYRLLQQYPNSLKVIQIAAACDSLTGKFTEAIAGYQKCLKIAPKTLAYANNQAWNLIQLKDYEIAMTVLSDIIEKWNHPAIFTNWAIILQNVGGNQKPLEETIKKKDKFQRDYPQYRKEGRNELIHTFLMKPEENYTGELEDLRAEVFELAEVLRGIQRAPIDIQTLKQRMQFMSERIQLRKQQEQKYGFVIDPQYKIILTGLQMLQTNVLKHYQSKYAKELDLDRFVLKAIEFIRDELLSQKIKEGFDSKSFQETKMIPTMLQVSEIGEFIQEKVEQLTGVKNVSVVKERQPIKQEKQELKKQVPQKVEYPIISYPQEQKVLYPIISQQEKYVPYRKQSIQNKPQKVDIYPQVVAFQVIKPQEPQRPANIQQDIPYQIKNQQNEDLRVLHNKNEFEQIQAQIEPYLLQKLRVQGTSETNPLFVILHSRQKMRDYYTIYINHRRANQQILSQTHIPDLSRLKSQNQKQKVKRYYFILSNILKFYNFYGTRNFFFERKNVRSDPGCLHFIQLICPVINHIFAQQQIFPNYKVGDIFKKIHNTISSYVNQTTKKGNFLRSFNKILKRIHDIVESTQKPVQNLIENMLQQKNLEYSSILLSNELINVDGSLRYHQYFIEKINKKQETKEDQNWLVFNVSLLVISFLQNSEEKQSLEERFVDCYYPSKVNQPIRNVILKKYFNANPDNKIPLVQKMSSGIKKILTAILP